MWIECNRHYVVKVSMLIFLEHDIWVTLFFFLTLSSVTKKVKK